MLAANSLDKTEYRVLWLYYILHWFLRQATEEEVCYKMTKTFIKREWKVVKYLSDILFKIFLACICVYEPILVRRFCHDIDKC